MKLRVMSRAQPCARAGRRAALRQLGAAELRQAKSVFQIVSRRASYSNCTQNESGASASKLGMPSGTEDQEAFELT